MQVLQYKSIISPSTTTSLFTASLQLNKYTNLQYNNSNHKTQSKSVFRQLYT